jgi:F-type H+-transporting ATPase subunit alpha
VLRRLAGDLRLLYAQLRELETFARFGAELEPATRLRLERGRRLREALKQPRLDPLRLGQEAASLFAVREGFLDAVPVAEVGRVLDVLRTCLEEAEPDLLAALEGADGPGDAVLARLRQVLESVRNRFLERANHESGADAATAPGREHDS